MCVCVYNWETWRVFGVSHPPLLSCPNFQFTAALVVWNWDLCFFIPAGSLLPPRALPSSTARQTRISPREQLSNAHCFLPFADCAPWHLPTSWRSMNSVVFIFHIWLEFIIAISRILWVQAALPLLELQFDYTPSGIFFLYFLLSFYFHSWACLFQSSPV